MSARHHLDIGPMPTAEEMAARRRRLLGPAKVINLRPRLEPPSDKPQEPHDAHVHAYDAFLATRKKRMLPAAYVRFLCEACSAPYKTITNPCRNREVVIVKHWMIAEVRRRFPSMSMPQIGKVFGGLDHTSVLHALRKHGYVSTGNRNDLTQEKVDRILAMHVEGARFVDIADAVGCAVDTARAYIDPSYRERRREWVREQQRKVKAQSIERAAGI